MSVNPVSSLKIDIFCEGPYRARKACYAIPLSPSTSFFIVFTLFCTDPKKNEGLHKTCWEARK